MRLAFVLLVSHRRVRGYGSACPDGAPSFLRTGSLLYIPFENTLASITRLARGECRPPPSSVAAP
eukprot:5815181-Prymnesium_polylepis.1